MIETNNFYWIAKNISQISQKYGINFGGYQNVDFEFEMEPTSVPKRKRQEDTLNHSNRVRGSDGNSNVVPSNDFQPGNLDLDSGSR